MIKKKSRWQAGVCLGLLVLGPTASATPAGSKTTARVTAAWLVGKWGPYERDYKGGNCEIDGDLYFKRGGTYEDGDGHGRYRTNGTHLIYYDRVEVDGGDNTEDRSNFHHPLITRVIRLSDRTFREDGVLYVRCLNAD